MKIIDSKKDYYDYVSGIMGIDDLAIFDRRKSIVIKPNELNGDFWIDRAFSTVQLVMDKKKHPIKRFWSLSNYIKSKIKENMPSSLSFNQRLKYEKKFKNMKVGELLYFLVECGRTKYYIEVERYIGDDDKIHMDANILEKKEHCKEKEIDAPLGIVPCYHSNPYSIENKWYVEKDKEPLINPILEQTYIPKLIPAYDMWNDIYAYISSLKDKPFEDNRSNDHHIENAGFDKKTSFRPNLKKK